MVIGHVLLLWVAAAAHSWAYLRVILATATRHAAKAVLVSKQLRLFLVHPHLTGRIARLALQRLAHHHRREIAIRVRSGSCPYKSAPHIAEHSCDHIPAPHDS